MPVAGIDLPVAVTVGRENRGEPPPAFGDCSCCFFSLEKPVCVPCGKLTILKLREVYPRLTAYVDAIGHVFCEKCLNDYITTSTRNTPDFVPNCPMCRREFLVVDTRTLFLDTSGIIAMRNRLWEAEEWIRNQREKPVGVPSERCLCEEISMAGGQAKKDVATIGMLHEGAQTEKEAQRLSNSEDTPSLGGGLVADDFKVGEERKGKKEAKRLLGRYDKLVRRVSALGVVTRERVTDLEAELRQKSSEIDAIRRTNGDLKMELERQVMLRRESDETITELRGQLEKEVKLKNELGERNRELQHEMDRDKEPGDEAQRGRAEVAIVMALSLFWGLVRCIFS